MKKIVLILEVNLALSFGIIGEALADWSANCPRGTTEGTTCKKCGTDCAFTQIDNGAVTLYGSGEVADVYNYYNGSGFVDQYNNPNPFGKNSSITSVSFADTSNFTSIGMYAFAGNSNLSNINLPNSLNNIGHNAFNGTGLTNITIPDSVTRIEGYAFTNTTNLTDIVVPDSVQTLEMAAFGMYDSDYINKNIICKGTEKTCANLKSQLNFYAPWVGGKMDFRDKLNPANSQEECEIGVYIWNSTTFTCNRMSENQCNDYRDENGNRPYYYNGLTCTSLPKSGKATCVNPNYKANDGYCDRLRYTPAEAAEVLRNDNTNEVTITFKK